MRRWLNRPLTDQALLRRRYHAVGALGEGARFEAIRERLRRVGDLERILARVALRSARPRDLVALRASLGALPALRTSLAGIDAPLLAELHGRMDDHEDAAELLCAPSRPNPSAFLRDGDVIAAGYDAELDELRRISDATPTSSCWSWSARARAHAASPAEARLQPRAGLLHRDPAPHAERVPADYLRRQTVKTAERFITPELKGFEDKVLGARDKALAREKELYEAVLTQLIDRARPACRTRRRRSPSSTPSPASPNARRRCSWTQPQLTDEPVLKIDCGRHPVVEQFSVAPFVPNDLILDDDRRMLIITGPNMGGKSTYMRQAALIVVLAHIGSFVPAQQRDARAARPHLHAHRRRRTTSPAAARPSWSR